MSYQYPNLDLEFLADEVEERIEYSNIVTYFDEALEHNIHFHLVLRNEILEQQFTKFESIYLKILLKLLGTTEILLSLDNGCSQRKVETEEDLVNICRAGIREQQEFVLLLPLYKVIIASAPDLKVVVFWPKNDLAPQKIINLFKTNNVSYE
jgi:hypothetical protein